jgi:hypothetical protein
MTEPARTSSRYRVDLDADARASLARGPLSEDDSRKLFDYFDSGANDPAIEAWLDAYCAGPMPPWDASPE